MRAGWPGRRCGRCGRNGRRPRASGRSAPSQALVEIAFAGPRFFMLVFGTINFGQAIFMYSGLHNLAREGARYAKAKPTDTVRMKHRPARLVVGTRRAAFLLPSFRLPSTGGEARSRRGRVIRRLCCHRSRSFRPIGSCMVARSRSRRVASRDRALVQWAAARRAGRGCACAERRIRGERWSRSTTRSARW